MALATVEVDRFFFRPIDGRSGRGHHIDAVGFEDFQHLAVVPQALEQPGKRFAGDRRLGSQQRIVVIDLIDAFRHQELRGHLRVAHHEITEV